MAPAVVWGPSSEVKENHHDDKILYTNCSASGGGSGQLLMAPIIVKNEIVRWPNGQPKLAGFAMFQVYDKKVEGIQVPNVEGLSGFAIFTDHFYWSRIALF